MRTGRRTRTESIGSTCPEPSRAEEETPCGVSLLFFLLPPDTPHLHITLPAHLRYLFRYRFSNHHLFLLGSPLVADDESVMGRRRRNVVYLESVIEQHA